MRHQFRNRLVQSVNGRQEQGRSAGPCRQPLPDAAGEKRSHDEPFGCAYELHRINEVTLREDRQPDRVVQQDQRNDEQRSAEEQPARGGFCPPWRAAARPSARDRKPGPRARDSEIWAMKPSSSSLSADSAVRVNSNESSSGFSSRISSNSCSNILRNSVSFSLSSFET